MKIDFKILESMEKNALLLGKENPNKVKFYPWLKNLRKGLGLSLEELGSKMKVTKQSIKKMENNEAIGSISIHSMNKIAESLQLDFVYAFIPKEGTFSEMIDLKARKMAESIVLRASQTMKLENQGLENDWIEIEIESYMEKIKKEFPSHLWT